MPACPPTRQSILSIGGIEPVDGTVELVSTDGWASATIVRQKRSIMSMPMAAAILGDDVYMLNSRLDTLFDSAADKVGDYLLQKF